MTARPGFVAPMALFVLFGSLACAPGDSLEPKAPTPGSTATNTALPESTPTPAPAATADPRTWRNGTERCPMPPHVTVPPGGTARGNANKSFCVVWSADFPDETGFRVTVRYLEGAREVFTHTVGPDEHDFVFPQDEAPVLVGAKCNDRRSFNIEVFALRPGGEQFVGGEGTVAECRLAP